MGLFFSSIITLGILFASTLFAQCQHPYYSGPNTQVPQAPLINRPIIYNSQYCYQGNCYPGAYVSAAIDKEGHVAPTLETSSDKLKEEFLQVGVERFTAPNYKRGLVRHIVLFRYAETISQEQKQEVIKRFLALKNLAKKNGKTYIVSIETGSETSGEGADQNLEQAFVVTFKSQGDRNFYVGAPIVNDPKFFDPAHQEFKDFVGPLLYKDASGIVTGVLVFDFSP